MKPFTNSEIVGFQKTQAESLMSKCKIQTNTRTYDELGDAISSFSESPELSVGIKLESEGKASFRFQVGTDLGIGDLIIVTQLFTSLHNASYKVIEVIPSGMSVVAKGVLIG